MQSLGRKKTQFTHYNTEFTENGMRGDYCIYSIHAPCTYYRFRHIYVIFTHIKFHFINCFRLNSYQNALHVLRSDDLVPLHNHLRELPCMVIFSNVKVSSHHLCSGYWNFHLFIATKFSCYFFHNQKLVPASRHQTIYSCLSFVPIQFPFSSSCVVSTFFLIQ